MRPAWFRAAAVLAVVLPGVPLAFEWSGRAGAVYSRDDQWTPASGSTSLPRLDIELALDGRGHVYTPDALTWAAGVGYRRFTMDPSNGPSSAQNLLSYRLSAVAFGRRGSPFTLSGFANRSEGDGSASLGSYGTTEQTFGGSMQLNLLNRPTLRLGYAHSDGKYTSPIYATHDNRRDVFDAATGYATNAFSFDVQYRGNLATGTYDAENYDDHRVDLASRVNVFKDVTVQLSDGYYRRVPTRTSTFNPRQELNSFTAFGRHATLGSVSTEQVRYNHTSALTETLTLLPSAGAPRTSVLTRSIDSLDVEVRRPLTEKEWSLATTASATYADTALETGNPAVPDERLRTAGQALTPVVHWAREVEDVRYRAHAGPSFGLLEPFDGTTEFGWGASAGGSVQRRFARLLAGSTYSIAYAKAVGTPTTSFAQTLSVDAEGNVGPNRLRAIVAASGERSTTPLIGTSASRSVRGNVEYGQRNWAAFAEVQLRDGVAFPLRDAFRGDGLFLSPGYDSRSTSILGGLRGGWAGLSAQGSLRLSNVVLPDRPSQDDLEARGEVSYRLGAFGVGVEERYLLSLRDRASGNVFFFRIYRLLGSRY